jgi:hypothetical protein
VWEIEGHALVRRDSDLQLLVVLLEEARLSQGLRELNVSTKLAHFLGRERFECFPQVEIGGGLSGMPRS